jgi:hypothetical protein
MKSMKMEPRIEPQNIVREIEEIKVRLISVETLLIESKKATEEDKMAVKEAIKEYKTRKTIPF